MTDVWRAIWSRDGEVLCSLKILPQDEALDALNGLEDEDDDGPIPVDYLVRVETLRSTTRDLHATIARLERERELDKQKAEEELAKVRDALADRDRRLAMVHGAEAEELRAGIEHLISVGHTACYDLRNDLQDLLDSVDARDSLTFHEAKEQDEQARDTLAILSSWVGNGLGDDSVSASDYNARIRDGVDRLLRVETERRDATIASLERELSESRQAQLVPVQWVPGFEDADEHCTECGAPVTDSHTWKDCLATVRGQHAQVENFEKEERARLERELAEAREEWTEACHQAALDVARARKAETALADRDARLARIAKGKWNGCGRSVGKFCCSHCEAIDGDTHAVDCPLYDLPTERDLHATVDELTRERDEMSDVATGLRMNLGDAQGTIDRLELELKAASRLSTLIVVRVCNALAPGDVRDGDEVEDAVRRVRVQRDRLRAIMVKEGLCCEGMALGKQTHSPDCLEAQALGEEPK